MAIENETKPLSKRTEITVHNVSGSLVIPTFAERFRFVLIAICRWLKKEGRPHPFSVHFGSGKRLYVARWSLTENSLRFGTTIHFKMK